MRKVNTNSMAEVTWASPKGKFVGAGKEISEELGRQPRSTDLAERHPFDVEICRIPPAKTPYPYHSHSAQWEFYHVISGKGVVRHKDGVTPIEPGDAFIFHAAHLSRAQILRDFIDPSIIDENNPENAMYLLAYLNREQYGDWPLVKGQYFNAPVIAREDGTPVYAKDPQAKKYVITDDRKFTIPVYDPRFMTLFPRMWANSSSGSLTFLPNSFLLRLRKATCRLGI